LTGLAVRFLGERYRIAVLLIIIIIFLVYLYITFYTLNLIYKERKKFIKTYLRDNITFLICLIILFISEGVIYINTSGYNFAMWLFAALFLAPTFSTHKIISDRFCKIK
jgi:phosphatidylglycerophosphate synthase